MHVGTHTKHFRYTFLQHASNQDQTRSHRNPLINNKADRPALYWKFPPAKIIVPINKCDRVDDP